MNLKCNKCNHEWTPRSKNLPKICPKCKTGRWHENNNIKIDTSIHNIPGKKDITEQEYLDAKKTVDVWEVTHGGIGSLRRAMEEMQKCLKKAEAEGAPS